MKKNLVKENYLLTIIMVGLLIISTYSTYALFLKTETTSNDVVTIETTLLLNTASSEFNKITVSANTVQTYTIVVDNSTGNTLYYGVWYEMIGESSPEMVYYSSSSANNPSGTVSTGNTRTVTIVINNYTNRQVSLYVGVNNSLTSSLNINAPRYLITESYDLAATSTVPLVVSSTLTTNTYNVTNTIQNFVVPYNTTYTLKVWGAQGGSYNQTYGRGGYGGYSTGTINLTVGTTLYVVVGAQGSYGTSTDYTAISGGGFNGGGDAGYRGGAGGGATHIATRTGNLSALSSYTANILIVAGGGGGSYYYSNTYRAYGGSGGGMNGVNGNYYSSSYRTYLGHGGTQTAGGTSGNVYTNTFSGTDGAFGLGGNTGYKYNSTSYYSSGAGGGGFYGGGAADHYNGSYSRTRYASGGGGGSGYIGNPNLLNKFMYCYYCTENTAVNTYTYNTASISASPTVNYAKSGGGYAQIEYYPLLTRVAVSGLSDLSITTGTTYNLTTGVTCVNNGYGCTISKIRPSTTTNLTVGRYRVTYFVTDTAGTVFMFYRNLIVT